MLAPKAGCLPVVAGDVKLVVRLPKVKRPLLTLWFHTSFLEGGGAPLVVPKSMLDKARKNKQLPPSFAVSIAFEEIPPGEEEAAERKGLAARARVRAGLPPEADEEEDEDEDEDDEDEAAEAAAPPPAAVAPPDVKHERV